MNQLVSQSGIRGWSCVKTTITKLLIHKSNLTKEVGYETGVVKINKDGGQKV